jgi:hypothetical protein
MMPEVSEGREGSSVDCPSAPNCLKLVVEILLTSYKYALDPPRHSRDQKVRFSFL